MFSTPAHKQLDPAKQAGQIVNSFAPVGPDFRVLDQGSVVVFTPLSAEARSWVNEFIGIKHWQRLGGGFALGHRDAQYLADAITFAGFTGELV